MGCAYGANFTVLLCFVFCLGGCIKSPVSKYNRLDGTTWVPATLEQTRLGGFGDFIASLKFHDKKFKLNLPVASLAGIPGLVITGTYNHSDDKIKFIIDDVENITISGEFFGNDSIVLDIDNVNNILRIEFIKKNSKRELY
jgi:hypothetical protein